MTELEYNVAAQLSEKREKTGRTKEIEAGTGHATWAPQRVESVAREKLQMSYPESNQVIVLKYSGE